MATKRRRFIFRATALLVGLVLAIAVGEIASTAYAYLRYGTTSVSELHVMEMGNTFVTACNRATPSARRTWLPRQDSNLNWMDQNHLCYHYTTG